MKRFLLILISIFCFVFLSGFAFSFSGGIDRSENLKYPMPKHGFVTTVFLNLKHGNVYHERIRCDVEEILLGLDADDNIEMTKYEAVLRGFTKCPECTDLTDSSLYNIESTLGSIEQVVDIIYEYYK